MTFHGQIKDGVIVLADVPAIPNGTVVEVQIVPVAPAENSGLGERLLKFAGKAADLPSDLATNHDHYLHGTPKS